MPKNVISIVDISEGINSDFNPKLISNSSAASIENLLINRAGRIIPINGFVNNGALAVSNDALESGLYSFRTDNNTNNPVEYLLSQDGTTVTIRNADGLGIVGSFSAPTNAGFVYSNGSLYVYSRDLNGDSFVMLSGTFTDAGKFVINYNTQQLTTAIFKNDVYENGSLSPDVKLKFNVYEQEVTEINELGASVKAVIKGQAMHGVAIMIDYLEETYNLGTLDTPSTAPLGFQIFEGIESHPNIPLTAIWNNAIETLTITSKKDGEEGNGELRIYPFGATASIFDGTISGGENAIFDDAGNIDKVIPSGKYNFAASYVLWDGSETSIKETSSEILFENRVKVAMRLEIDAGVAFANFIKGIKFYLQSESFEFSLLAEYKEGTKRFRFFNENDFSVDSLISHEVDLTLPLLNTFRFESGYNNEKLATPRHKSFIIVNNRGYALNVKYGSNFYPDRIIVSPQGKPFLLPEDNRIDIVTEDGDEYVTAEHFGQFLYCFKKLTLFVLNISSNEPASFSLQDSIFGVGVNSPAAVCKTEFGIFWANENGIYTHNGQNINNIIFGKIEDEYKAINSSVIRCGYDIINKKVLICRGLTVYVYDFKTSGFYKITNLGAGNKSNFVLINKEININVGGTLRKFSIENGTTGWQLTSKAFNLGVPSVRKKIRRFYVTFRQENINLENIDFFYKLDDTNTWTEVTNKTFVNTDDDVNKNTVVMVDLPRSITAYSIQLKLQSSSVSSEISDISIVYRAKSPK